MLRRYRPRRLCIVRKMFQQESLLLAITVVLYAHRSTSARPRISWSASFEPMLALTNIIHD